MRTFLASLLVGLSLVPSIAFAVTPNDPAWNDISSSIASIHLPGAWNITQGSRSVVVAVIDTGVDITNPDIASNVWSNPDEQLDGKDNDNDGYVDDLNGWNFVNDTPNVRPDTSTSTTRVGLNHGTVVSGIIGAQGNNFLGSAGVAWNVKLMPLKILDEHGDGDTDLAAKAIDYAIKKKADIINLSFVGPTPSLNFIQAIRRAYRAGILVVAAAGNGTESANGVNLNIVPRYPVCFDDPLREENWVLGVGALDDRGLLASFSNYGDKCVDISAPGYHIPSTEFFDPAKGYTDVFGGSWSGTSIAAPYVTGVAALIKSIQPTWTADKILKALVSNSDPIPGNSTHAAGYGSLNAERAVLYALQGGDGGIKPGIFVSLQRARNNQIHATLFDEGFKKQRDFVVGQAASLDGVTATTADLDASGVQQIIVSFPSARGSVVRVYQRDGKLVREFKPFGTKERGPLQLVAADLNADGKSEIILAPAKGQVARIMNGTGQLETEIQVPAAAGSTLRIGTVRDENAKMRVLTSVSTASQSTVYLWDAIGSFVGSFTAPAALGQLSFGTVDRDGNGVEYVYSATQKGGDITVSFVSTKGDSADTRTFHTDGGQISGLAFGRVQGYEDTSVVVPVRRGSNLLFDVFALDGTLRMSTTTATNLLNNPGQLYYAR